MTVDGLNSIAKGLFVGFSRYYEAMRHREREGKLDRRSKQHIEVLVEQFNELTWEDQIRFYSLIADGRYVDPDIFKPYLSPEQITAGRIMA